MMLLRDYKIAGLLLLTLFLTGCATTGGQPDATGNLGLEKRDSPGKIYVEMGIAYMRDGQDAVALQKLRRGLEVDEQNPEAHNVIAILYERLGENDLAARHYDRAVNLDPRDPYIRNARGSYYCKQNRYEMADQEFLLALDNPLYPTPWVALNNAGLCAERAGDMVMAETYYRRALTANPRYSTALFQMAELSLEQQKGMSARAYLERYHGEVKGTAASLWLGVQIEQRLGDRQKVVEYKRRLLKEFPDAPEIQALNQSERQ
ncbi:MAG: type IV pilus biogenesis/stability protein PilW [Candidatus Thiodiazotropha sp. (ex Gloverina cf. vestifex)]|nr:type IV pilus biogenesis/stability protein PilW [Candidatus Thiodiazotropha sp. (ex Gloverina cf. vestifex)]